MTKDDSLRKVSEATVEYFVSSKEEPAVTTISTKNQITLPAHLLREMGLEAGDRLAITREGSRLILRARPRDWVKYHAGSLTGLYGKDLEAADEYVRQLRAADAERDQAVEEAWSGREPPAQP